MRTLIPSCQHGNRVGLCRCSPGAVEEFARQRSERFAQIEGPHNRSFTVQNKPFVLAQSGLFRRFVASHDRAVAVAKSLLRTSDVHRHSVNGTRWRRLHGQSPPFSRGCAMGGTPIRHGRGNCLGNVEECSRPLVCDVRCRRHSTPPQSSRFIDTTRRSHRRNQSSRAMTGPLSPPQHSPDPQRYATPSGQGRGRRSPRFVTTLRRSPVVHPTAQSPVNRYRNKFSGNFCAMIPPR